MTDKKFWIVNKLNSNVAEILIYDYIGQYDGMVKAGDFVKELRALEKNSSKINIRINSGGGSVYDGIAIYNAIKASKCTIDTYIDGIAASMGSVIALAGNKVYMSRMARLMTHKPSGGAWGTSDELRATANELDALEKIMGKEYATKTGCTEAEALTRYMNGKDNYFGADAAMKAKLIDDIYDLGDEVDIPTDIGAKEMWGLYNNNFQARITNDFSTLIMLT